MNIVGTQSTTFQNAEGVNGFELDQSYYIANVENVRDITTVDIMVDPPPDLVIEIDITTPEVEKIDRRAMYERVRVPEFWRYSPEKGLETFAVRGVVYQPITISDVIPSLAIGEVGKRLRTTPANLLSVIREWQDWLRTHRPPSV
jgi:Uma2 family endonuclease